MADIWLRNPKRDNYNYNIQLPIQIQKQTNKVGVPNPIYAKRIY